MGQSDADQFLVIFAILKRCAGLLWLITSDNVAIIIDEKEKDFDSLIERRMIIKSP